MVDRLHVEMLERQGIDTNNPLLALLYDDHEGFSHSVARGMVAMHDELAKNEPLSVDVIKALATTLGARLSTGIGFFGAFYSQEGMNEKGRWMEKLDHDFKVPTAIASNDFLVRRKNGANFGAKVGEREVRFGVPAPIRAYLKSKLPTIRLGDGNPADALASNSAQPPSDGLVMSMRSGDMQKESDAIMHDIVARFEESRVRASTPEERIEAAARLYFEGEHTHMWSDANYRLFGKLMLNYCLAKIGETPTELRDPYQADGRSPSQLVEDIKEGQQWFQSLCRREADAADLT